MMRYVCIHGHFYQPPRENPWLEYVELQESAYPYHDWNERVTAECYAPNAASRILDSQGRITQIIDNYSRISFDFGPTLLEWLETSSPETYAAVLAADRASRERFGHGSALAQAYNHIILPLANERDRRTQVIWGLRDFESRFGRPAEGMWLPETAANLATLESLAEQGVRFTILAPAQAAAVRPIGAKEWTDVSGERIDTSRPYVARLPSGRKIVIFFYDGPVSRAVAFENLLADGARFAERLIGLSAGGTTAQIASIATDGETYGHHHRFGDMALSYALHTIGAGKDPRLTNYATFLAQHAPADEVRIVENTSWSCAHGLERWRSDCGCHAGGKPGWNQAWRAPLRGALDWLRDRVAPLFEAEAGKLLRDPWAARDDYIAVVLDRSDPGVAAFLERHARSPCDQPATARILKLLELQRHAMLMYTSCAWFFHDIAGIETVQILRYAGRVVQLAQDLFAETMESELLQRLEAARSNDREAGDGRRLYERHVKPAMVDLLHVGAHFAVSSVFPGHEPHGRVYCYRVELEDQATSASGDATLAVGKVRVTSEITREADRLSFAVLHYGNHDLSGGIRRLGNDEEHERLKSAILDAFAEAALPPGIEALAEKMWANGAGERAELREFPAYTFSLKSLFLERQHEILYRLIDARLREAEVTYRQLYDQNLPTMRYLNELGVTPPRAFSIAAEFILNRDLARTLTADSIDLSFARSLLDEARAAHIALDREGLSFAIRAALERLAARGAADAPDTRPLEDLLELLAMTRSFGFEVDLWRVQNTYYRALERVYPPLAARARDGDAAASRWVERFTTVGTQLSVAVG